MNNILYESEIFRLFKETIYFGILGFVISFLLSPLAFLRTQKQKTNLSYILIYKQNIEKYGYKVLYSGALYYVIFNTVSLALFGFLDFFSIKLVKNFYNQNSFLGLFIRSLIIGIIDSILIMFIDYKAIKSQKLESKNNTNNNLWKFSICYIIKNTTVYFGIMFGLYFWYNYPSLGNFYLIAIGFFIGGLFSFITLPLDFIIVNIISPKKESIYRIFSYALKNYGFNRVFSGGLMKFIILAIYTIFMNIGEILIRLL